MDIAIAGGTGIIGSHVVRVAQQRGHAVRVLSRRGGVDVRAGVGLENALRGVDAVIDVLNITTTDAKKATEFFMRTTANLLAGQRRDGTGHHLALSIVGVDRAPYDYYAGKLAQEAAVASGEVPWTILRATQFHDFAGQIHSRSGFGPLHPAVRMRTQPIDAGEVATRLVELAEHPAHGRARDIAGPREEELADMMRAWAAHHGRRGWMPRIGLPGAFGRAMRSGVLLPQDDADLRGVTFAEWLSAQPER